MSDRPAYRLHGLSWAALASAAVVFALLNAGEILALLMLSPHPGWPFPERSLFVAIPWMLLFDLAIAATAIVGVTAFVESRIRRGVLPERIQINIGAILAVMATFAVWIAFHRPDIEHWWTLPVVPDDLPRPLVVIGLLVSRLTYEFARPAAYLCVCLAFVSFLDLVGQAFNNEASQSKRLIVYLLFLLPFILRALWILFSGWQSARF